MQKIQGDVDKWIRGEGGYWGEFEILGRLMEELGEVAQSLRKNEGSKTKEEVGDLFFTLIASSNKLASLSVVSMES